MLSPWIGLEISDMIFYHRKGKERKGKKVTLVGGIVKKGNLYPLGNLFSIFYFLSSPRLDSLLFSSIPSLLYRIGEDRDRIEIEIGEESLAKTKTDIYI